MSEIPDPWSAYARLQEKLANRNQVDDYTWGLEAGLTRLLTENFPAVRDVERAVESESRKERYRAQLRRIYLNVEAFSEGPENALDARRRLRLIETRVAAEDWALLRAVGDGNHFKEIAIVKKLAPGALRARVFRLRRTLLALAG
jgi:hypothetical protein